jgi:hypothetical protein
LVAFVSIGLKVLSLFYLLSGNICWLAIISFELLLVAAETRSSVRIVETQPDLDAVEPQVRSSTTISAGLQTCRKAVLKNNLSGS